MPRQRNTSAPRTRRAILEHLKQDGPQDAGSLAEALGITAMAVRQHLYALEAEQLITFREEPRPLGRPAKLWRLTEAADSFFPNGHADLTLDLLVAMRSAFGERGLDKLIAARTDQQAADYGERVAKTGPLKPRLKALAELRTEEGYMASVEPDGVGGYLLVENHCPICAAARTCQGLCAGELALFRRVLGDGVTVERIDHILAGARRCAYRVAKADG